ncbi:hypothetical protein E2C01_029112 [Portunus trituberculatus]|uniref:Uncharacterized protein n=1 Tax=Portunus trituberculatus TaxID=210409 RepID=A0A5B7ERY4_PORTR|nr:hypothetical protein [Portunus trituberculatus]
MLQSSYAVPSCLKKKEKEEEEEEEESRLDLWKQRRASQACGGDRRCWGGESGALQVLLLQSGTKGGRGKIRQSGQRVKERGQGEGQTGERQGWDKGEERGEEMREGGDAGVEEEGTGEGKRGQKQVKVEVCQVPIHLWTHLSQGRPQALH